MANWVISVFCDGYKAIKHVMLTLFQTMLRIILEYSCPVLSLLLWSAIKKLERLQRAFTRHITGCKGLGYWDRLKFLGLMSLQRRRYISIHVWKILKGLAPNDISSYSEHNIRLGTRCNIPHLPRNAPVFANSIYDKSFAVTDPKLWN